LLQQYLVLQQVTPCGVMLWVTGHVILSCREWRGRGPRFCSRSWCAWFTPWRHVC